jgi:hypothetical protein
VVVAVMVQVRQGHVVSEMFEVVTVVFINPLHRSVRRHLRQLNLAVLEKFCRAKKYLAFRSLVLRTPARSLKAKYFLALQNFSKTARFNDPLAPQFSSPHPSPQYPSLILPHRPSS